MGALISSEQTPRVMGMFSGCYLVLCGNEIARHLYHQPLEGLLTITGARTCRLPGDTHQPVAWEKKRGCQGIVGAESGMTDRRLEGVLWLGSLSRPRESTLCLEGCFGLCSCYLDRMLNVWTSWNVKHEEKSDCEPWHIIKRDIKRDRVGDLKNSVKLDISYNWQKNKQEKKNLWNMWFNCSISMATPLFKSHL